jgi:hypothetical protein
MYSITLIFSNNKHHLFVIWQFPGNKIAKSTVTIHLGLYFSNYLCCKKLQKLGKFLIVTVNIVKSRFIAKKILVFLTFQIISNFRYENTFLPDYKPPVIEIINIKIK